MLLNPSHSTPRGCKALLGSQSGVLLVHLRNKVGQTQYAPFWHQTASILAPTLSLQRHAAQYERSRQTINSATGVLHASSSIVVRGKNAANPQSLINSLLTGISLGLLQNPSP